MLFIVWLRLQQKLLFFVHERDSLDVISSESAATPLNIRILLLFFLLNRLLKVVEAIPEKLFEGLPNLVLRYSVLSIFVEEIQHRLRHSIALDLFSDAILVDEDINKIFSTILESFREDPVEHLINQLHHLHVLRLEELLEAAPLQRL